MDYLCLGSSGLKVSRIGLGMMSYGDPRWRDWVLDETAAEPIVRGAVEAGVIYFDTADVYSTGTSERITGHLLRRHFARREDYVLATKVQSAMGPGPNDRGLSRTHILSAIDASLRRLGTDHVDLYQIHRWDPDTPIEETMEALHDVVRAGKARYLGASNLRAWQLAKAQHAAELHGWTRFVSMQSHYNLLYREAERELLPLCLDMGVGFLPWSPLARGVLAGTRTREAQLRTIRARSDLFAEQLYEASDFDVVDALTEAAKKRGLPTAQIALAWLLRRPEVVAPVVGATRVDHVEDAVAAVEVPLSDAEVAALEEPYRPHDVHPDAP